MSDLGDAINESIAHSERVAAVIGDLKQAGYDVLLVFEATIGLNRTDDRGADKAEGVSVQ